MSEVLRTYVLIRTTVERGHTIGANAGRSDVGYWAIDHHSGGYPYWSSSVGNAKAFNDVEEAVTELERHCEYMERQALTEPEIVIVTETAEVVRDFDLNQQVTSKRREKALAKLTDAEKEALGLS